MNGGARARVRMMAAIACAAPCFFACAPTPPAPVDAPAAPHTDRAGGRIPAFYVLVGPAGTTAYATPPRRADVGAPGTRLGPGFGFVATEERSVGGHRYVRIQDGRWLLAAGVTRARPSTFAGAAIAAGETLRFGWVIASEATVRAQPAPSARVVTTRPAHTRVRFAGPCAAGWCPLAVGFMRTEDLATVEAAARPGRVGPLERWLDIDLRSQTLVAYEGDRPVYATLISAGIGLRGSPLATPVGLFAITSKHALVRMDNLEHTDVVPYSYDVPLAQYFTDGKAVHAALWHDRFGHATSHGCVNLAPRDAEWLFSFTAPLVPRGADKASGTPTRPGTPLRIRGELPAVALR